MNKIDLCLLKYIACYAADNMYEEFNTYDEAEKWLQELYDTDGPEGFAEETVNGRDYIAAVVSRSRFVVQDKKENYHEHTDACPEDCDEEEWPYSDSMDLVGQIELQMIVDQKETGDGK